MQITKYIEPDTGREFDNLPKLWNNIAGLTAANCVNFGWQIIIDEVPEEEPETEPLAIQLDREKLKAWITAKGRGAMLNGWSSLPLPLAEWWFLSCQYVEGHPNAVYLQQLLQLSDDEMKNLVEVCHV